MPPTLAEALAANRQRRRGSLLVYLMVDAARRSRLATLARACKAAGVTGIELGFPFSDPIADGPVLQAAASRALGNGTTWNDLLCALPEVARELPVAVMTYANPVFHRGLRTACREIARSGGTGLIVPDLALEESGPWKSAAREAGLALVQMGSPATPRARIPSLVDASSGFLYLVSRYGTTGVGRGATRLDLKGLVQAAHVARPGLPVLIGFGVRSTDDLRPVLATGADGAIVGSAVEELLSKSMNPERLTRFLHPLTGALELAAGG